MVNKTKLISAFILITLLITPLFANQQLYNQLDSLYWGDKYEDVVSLIESELNKGVSGEVKAQLLWRLSRATLAIGDELKEQGASKDLLFETFEKGESYAQDSIDEYPLAMGYVYHASNIGRWGETKGPLNSLSKAKPMRDDFIHVIDEMGVTDETISWYVLGQLYFKLPGWPISFGDLDTAISYTRKAIDAIPTENLYHGHFKALAEMLYKRDLTAKKRVTSINNIKNKWDKEKGSVLDQHAYYEGANGAQAKPFYSPVSLGQMSDRQEAVMLLKYALAKYDIWPFHSRADKRMYQTIENLLKEWGY
ncbi:MAG: hypothetical protein ACOXZZ_02505 [Sphaerochaetaceae bacterium]|jgi:tetratricopeptide (TPR) repeat protein